jgi:hypothetical protein
MRVFGETAGGALFLTALCVLTHALYPILLFVVTRQIFVDSVVPLAVGLIAIAVPHFPPMIHIENIYLVDLMLLSFILTWRLSDHGLSSGHHALFAGLLGGICTLLNAATVVVWFPWIGHLYCRSGIRGRRLLTSVSLFLVSFSGSARECGGTPILWGFLFGGVPGPAAPPGCQ